MGFSYVKPLPFGKALDSLLWSVRRWPKTTQARRRLRQRSALGVELPWPAHINASACPR
ncbi:hypothetical protein I553_9049 [Mycobacterium xenopi 4042]|uniref:Uncharacterized protein n=1 Tax=Mycobacterium xenopi 4042 TaxID=1299334 RepID=X8AM04_MYCXE|nr:hypothetical protein I552_3730 [Mycobacterium xenopi 3993]EUA32912.1 hypothetical protein I553_9049 [Mycobacterium xenopi 4042]